MGLSQFDTAADLVAGFRSGDRSPVEAAEIALDAIERHNPALHAFCLVDREAALAAARAAERRWQAGEPLSPIDGVPTSIKDLYLTKGWPTLRGSLRVDPRQDWDVDSPIAERLREAGAVLLGKTTTAEFGWKGVTDNPVDGVTLNPWDPERTAGGSSGGSGAALAAGMGSLAIATDAGGSARIPASFCGVVGLKASYGRIPLFPASDLGTLAHAGPMARSVRDVATLLDVLAGPDPRDPNSLPAPGLSYRQAVEEHPGALRVAFSADFGGAVPVQPEVARAIAAAVEGLAAAGVRVEEADPPAAAGLEAFTVLWEAGMARLRGAMLGGSLERLDPGLADLIERGSRYSAADYVAARRELLEMSIAMSVFLDTFDALLTPTMPMVAFAAGHDCPPGGNAGSWQEWTPFTFPFNMSQQPALSVPIGTSASGMPVGLQVVGPRLRDDVVLCLGAAVERLHPRAEPPHLR